MASDEKSRMLITRGVVKTPGKRSAVVAAFAALLAVAFLCSLAASAVHAAPQAAPAAKLVKFSGIVVTANVASIVLRNPNDPRQQMGFSYSPAVHDQMLKIMTAGGYRYGDKVTVQYVPGTTIALKLRGKPSKPKKQQQPQPQQTQ